MNKILVTGALGQIGSELVDQLRLTYGNNHVIASDIKTNTQTTVNGPFEIVDVTDPDRLLEVARAYEVDTIMHLAAILSAKAEKNPKRAWDLNMGGLVNALEVARELNLQFFTPSSIGCFGPSTPKANTPQDTLQRPNTMYGINKVAGELLCDYYHQRFGLDTRGVRFPGLISYVTLPGGGTTDYAVDIYYQALKDHSYTSFIAEGTKMDMMYMPDAVNAIIQLMEADSSNLKHRNAFNISAMSVAPEDFAKAIQKHIPDFKIHYQVDPERQQIADSWPDSIDSTSAVEEWGFEPIYDIDTMTADMLDKISQKQTQ